MTMFRAVFAILAVLLALLGVCRLCLWWDRRREDRYDERQKEAQGTAYRVAFWVGVAYLSAVTFLTQFDLSVETWLLMLVGLMLMLMTHRFCCLLLKVGNTLFQNPKVAIACDLFLIGSSVVDLFGWFRMEGELWQMDSHFWFSMILGVCFILICLMDVAELRRNEEE